MLRVSKTNLRPIGLKFKSKMLDLLQSAKFASNSYIVSARITLLCSVCSEDEGSQLGEDFRPHYKQILIL